MNLLTFKGGNYVDGQDRQTQLARARILVRVRVGVRRDNNWLVKNFIGHPCKYESFLRNRLIANRPYSVLRKPHIRY